MIRYWFIANSTGIREVRCCYNCLRTTTRVEGLEVGMIYCPKHDCQVRCDHYCPNHQKE